jgi:aminopeptidase-like protein
VGGAGTSQTQEMALLWVLNLADGANSLLDMAERSGLSFDSIDQAAALLVRSGLLSEASAIDPAAAAGNIGIQEKSVS